MAEDFLLGGESRLRRCTHCDLVYAPEFADPAEVYVDGYLSGATDFGLDVLDPHFQQYLLHAAQVRLNFLDRHVARGRLLDVGCGTGDVLMAARAAGWDVEGVDPVQDAARYARETRGLPVQGCLLEDSGLPERSFDVVSAFHVLEHMTNATSFVRTLARWARPGGHVVIEVPNWRSFHRLRHGATWPGLRPLEHIVHFTPTTLNETMSRAGLEPVDFTTPCFLWNKQSVDEALADLGRIGWRKGFRPLSRADGGDPNRRVPTRLGWTVLRTTAWAYERAKVGTVVLAIARVP
jgi:SAM-dependent methyltransferase